MKPRRPHSPGWESLGSHERVCMGGRDGEATFSHQAGHPAVPRGRSGTTLYFYIHSGFKQPGC